MTIRDRALLHRRFNPSPDLCGRYIDTAALRARFGKYDGYELQDIPDWYLRWCLKKIDFDSHERRAVKIRLHQTPFKSVFLPSDPLAAGWRESEGSRLL